MGAARTSAFVKSATARKSAFAVVSLSVGATILVAGLGSPALAATGCPSGATLVAGSICEVVFTSTPSGVWTPPAGVTRVDALLVGAGGSGLYQYGGGGGDVQVVTLATSGDVNVTVGMGVSGNYDSVQDSVVTQGSDTFVAHGGYAPPSSNFPGFGGNSGNDNEANGHGGSGAGAASVDGNGGAGLVVSDIPEATGTLFEDEDSCFGGGGAHGSSTASCGGGFTTDVNSIIGTDPVANSGGGGGSWYYNGDINQDGADGQVVIRYPVPTLANTGAGDSTPSLIAGFGALLVGLSALMFGRRRKA